MIYNCKKDEVMKRLFLTLVLCISIVACTGGKSNNQGREYIPEKTNVQKFIEECLAANPEFNNNDVKRQALADTMRVRLQKEEGKSLSLLDGLPVKFEMSLPYSDGERYLVVFTCKDIETMISGDGYDTDVQFMTIMKKEDVANLTDNSLYYIQGTFKDFANCSHETGIVFPDGSCGDDYPSISQFSNSVLGVNIGTLVVESVKYKFIKTL